MSELTLTFAAAVYTPETGDRMAMLKFVEKQKAKSIKVGGLLQEAFFSADGELAGINAIDVTTGERILISRPMRNTDECGLDVSTLTQLTEVIEKARTEQLDLVVIEKFGNLEQDGNGLNDEILQTIADGIPLLISVPEAALAIWQERSGELGSVIEFTEESFEYWWQGVK
ncbi:MAG: nucleoside-triphosphatase THEP1 [Gammaproteobacteria bacterium]|jgi:nucleoside-triphosphatase THEP1